MNGLNLLLLPSKLHFHKNTTHFGYQKNGCVKAFIDHKMYDGVSFSPPDLVFRLHFLYYDMLVELDNLNHGAQGS